MWDLLSNSGEALKLIVPNQARKCLSGWTNYSGIFWTLFFWWSRKVQKAVTSYKISEKKMGYRGSKSVISKKIAVKEQRVYGSLCIQKRMHIRCTLTNFERNYQIKIPSKQINKLRSTNINLYNPYFITGFSVLRRRILIYDFNTKRFKI